MSAMFYIDGQRDVATAGAFNRLNNRPYQYFDFTYGNRRVVIEPTASHPAHHDRWRMVVGNNEMVFKGKTVCDVGGSEGFYSLRSALLGAKKVTLIERAPQRVACARILFDFFGVSQQITIVETDLQEIEFMPVDILLTMRILHWLIPHHNIDRKERGWIINGLFGSFKTAAFMHVDAKDIEKLTRIIRNIRRIETGDYGYFMGYIRVWR